LQSDTSTVESKFDGTEILTNNLILLCVRVQYVSVAKKMLCVT